MNLYERLARPVLFALDAERAHAASLAVLKTLPARAARPSDPGLAVEAFGLSFPNPIGMAAGFDKGGEVVDPLLGLGFGFVEVGTVTPLPQPGNAKPRLFRLPRDGAVINRLGFNSEGHARVLARLKARAARPGIIGVNLGANKDSPDRVEDYARGVEAFAAVASYFTINISSPNTPGLRDLQQADLLPALLSRVLEARERAASSGVPRRPVLLKIAPDVTLSELDAIVRAARDLTVEGMIIGNTTLARPASLHERGVAAQPGGLSGRPLFEPSTRLLAAAYRRVERAFPLVGVGGVDSGAAAFAKIEAGAALVQLYSALAFLGPSLPRRMVADLSKRVQGRPLERIVGSRAEAIARGEPAL